MDLPGPITAATGMDALTHNMEAFIAKMEHPLCEGIALEGIRLIHQSIAKAVQQPDLESRSQMLIASLMGAVAFQKGLGVVHSLAHPLSSLLDTHHGLANAVNLPYGMAFNISGSEEKFRRIARVLELKMKPVKGLSNICKSSMKESAFHSDCVILVFNRIILKYCLILPLQILPTPTIPNP